MRWSWLRDGVLPALQAFTESLWVYLLIVIVTALATPQIQLRFPDVIGLLFAGAIAGKIGAFLPIRFPLNRILALMLALAVVLCWLHLTIAPSEPWSLQSLSTLVSAPATFHTDASGTAIFLLCALALYLVGRGLLIGMQPPSTVAASRWFVAGAARVLTALLALTWTSAPTAKLPTDHVKAMLFGYFALGLATVALAHWQFAHDGVGLRSRLSLSWAAAILLPVSVVIAAASAIVGGVGQTIQGTAFS